MIDINQNVKIKWIPRTRKYYESLGYDFTGYDTELQIKAKDLKNGAGVKVDVQCDYCGKPRNMVYGMYNRTLERNGGIYLCSPCATKDRDRKRWPKEGIFQRFLDFCEKNGYEPITTIDEYEGVKSPAKFKCPEHGIQTIIIDNIKEDSIGCSGCINQIKSDKKKNSIEDVIKVIESKGNKLLNPEDYIGVGVNNLKIVCKSCGEVFTTSLASQMVSEGACFNCGVKKVANQLRFSVDELNMLYNKEEIVLLNPEDYVNSNTRNLRFKCSTCGEEFIVSKAHYDDGQTRCSKCTQAKSYGELIIEEYLQKHKIDFIFQKRFDDCRDKKTLPFDFYLTASNQVIEFDGKHHFEPVHGEDNFKTTQFHDVIKNEYCFINDIEMLRIPYWDSDKIEQILDDFFNK